MDLTIKPYEGVGEIRFGMSQAEVRALVGGEYETFLKSQASEMPTDDFFEKGIFVYYKQSGVCEAIEMALPAEPTFQGMKLMGRRFRELSPQIMREDPAAQKDSSGLESRMFGFGLYVPDIEDDRDARVEGVIVFEKGYYDE